MYLLLTVDISGDTNENRQEFYEELDVSGFHKVEGVTTTWYCSYPEDMSYSQIKHDIMAEVAKAASEAGIKKYKSVFHIGGRKPHSF